MTDDPDDPSKLDDLTDRLRAARAREEHGEGRDGASNGAASSGMGLGFRLAIELVAGIVVGAGLGWWLDRVLHTKPLLMVVFFFLGAAGGVMNVYRAAKGLDQSVGLGAAQRRKEQERKNG